MSLYRIRDCIGKCPVHTLRTPLLYDTLHRIPAERINEINNFLLVLEVFPEHSVHLRLMQAYCHQTKQRIVACDEK